MGMRINKTGRNHQAARVQGFICMMVGKLPDGRYDSITDFNIRRETGFPGSIHDKAAPNQ